VQQGSLNILTQLEQRS